MATPASAPAQPAAVRGRHLFADGEPGEQGSEQRRRRVDQRNIGDGREFERRDEGRRAQRGDDGDRPAAGAHAGEVADKCAAVDRPGDGEAGGKHAAPENDLPRPGPDALGEHARRAVGDGRDHHEKNAEPVIGQPRPPGAVECHAASMARRGARFALDLFE